MHGDLVFSAEVLEKSLGSAESCMTVSSTLPLPEKDFKAVVRNGRIEKVGVEFFDSAYAAQPLYHLYPEDWQRWLANILSLIHIYLTRIFSKTWVLILLFLPFFKPGSFEYLGIPFNWIDVLLTIAKAGVALFACLLYLYNKKLSALTVSAGVFSALLLLSTVLNHGNIKTALVYTVNIVGVCVLTELAARYSFRNLLRSLYYLLSVLLILHLASQFIFPNGMALHEYYNYKIYFMEIDNQMAPLVFLSMLVTILYSEYVYQRITWPAVGMLAVSSAIILKSWSASALVGWFIFLVFLVFFYRRKLGRFFKFHYLAAAYIVIFFSFVVFRLQNLLSFIIVDILHKDLTFTHRTEFWDTAYSLIAGHWFVGLGVPIEKGHIWSIYYNKFFYGHNIACLLYTSAAACMQPLSTGKAMM